MRLWIKDPLAILAADAERGVVVDGSRIVECVPRGHSPLEPCPATFDASRHVVLPGLVNAHHHFYQTLTRAHPAGFGRDLIPWLVAMERVWDRMTPDALRLAVRMALVELLLSGCTTAADHHNLFPPGLGTRPRHRGRGGEEARDAHDGHARLDGHIRKGRRPAARFDRAGLGHDPRGQRTGPRAVPRSCARRDDPGSRSLRARPSPCRSAC